MLKKSVFIGSMIIGLALTSCKSGEPSTMCDCVEVQVEIMEKTMDLPMDATEEREKIHSEYTKEMEKCEEIGETFQADNEGLSNEELQELQEKELEGCEAMDRLDEMIDKQMEKMKEAMGQ